MHGKMSEMGIMISSQKYSMLLLIGVLLIMAVVGLPTATNDPVNSLDEDATRLNRQSTSGVQNLLAGFTYTERMLLSCVSPTILPEMSTIRKQSCTGRGVELSSAYESVISALDKVLRIYDLQERFLSEDRHNASVEMRALQIVIDTLVNQTCHWMESLGVHYSSGNETFSCSSGIDSVAHIRKLRALISAYLLVKEAKDSTSKYVPDPTQTAIDWLNGVRSSLSTVFAGTDYEEAHLVIRPCRCRE